METVVHGVCAPGLAESGDGRVDFFIVGHRGHTVGGIRRAQDEGIRVV